MAETRYRHMNGSVVTRVGSLSIFGTGHPNAASSNSTPSTTNNWPFGSVVRRTTNGAHPNKILQKAVETECHASLRSWISRSRCVSTAGLGSWVAPMDDQPGFLPPHVMLWSGMNCAQAWQRVFQILKLWNHIAINMTLFDFH